MGERVNFNRKSTNSKKKKRILIFVVILIIVIVFCLLIKNYIDYYKLHQSNDTSNLLSYDISAYASLEELLYAYDVEFVRIDNSTDIDKIYVMFSKNLYTNGKSNQSYFKGVINVVAEYNNFYSFELIDLTRDIEIKVVCEDQIINQIIINGDENYYLNKDSDINANKENVIITPFTIQSEELQAFIDNNWKDTNINIGTKESRCNEYDIYFDEGIKYKKVSGEVFNLIFTEQYTGQVAGGLNVTSTPEEVISALGNPTFSEYTSIYGYMSEDNYLFFDFDNKEISIYPVKKVSKKEEEKLEELIIEMNKEQDIKTFASDLMDMWLDYDEYDYDTDFVSLKYTLKGISLEFSSANLGDDGIFIYQNYLGNRDIKDLENVYISDKNMIFELEKERVNTDKISRIEQGEKVEEQYEMYGNDFAIRFKGDLASSENGYKGPYFLSRDKSYPDSELDRTLVISSFKWYDNYRVIYSIDNEGIYIYDCRSRNNVLIKEINSTILINEVDNDKIVYNDNKIVNISIN